MAIFNLTGDRSVFDRIKTKKVEMMYTKYDDGVTEINFIVNGYKLHLDDFERCSIKKIVKEKYSKYRFVSSPEKKLKKEIPDYDGRSDSMYTKKYRQIITLTRTLILQLRFSKMIDEDLEMLFGTSDDDSIFSTVLSFLPKGMPFCGPIRDVWKEDYLEVFKKEQIGA